jgi:hypothetical protein
MLRNASPVIPRSESDEECRCSPLTRRTWNPRFARDDKWDVSDLRTWSPHSAGSPGKPAAACSLRRP